MIFGKIGEFFLGKGKASGGDGNSQKLREADELVAQFLMSCEGMRDIRYSENLSERLAPYLCDAPEGRALVIEASVNRASILDRQMREFRKKCKDPYNPHLVKGWDVLRNPRDQLVVLIERALKKKPLLNKQQLEKIVSWGLDQPYLHYGYFPLNGFVDAVEAYHRETGDLIEDDLKQLLDNFVTKLGAFQRDESMRRPTRRLKELLSVGRRLVIEKGEPWADFAISKLESLPAEHRDNWYRLLELCSGAGTGSPSKKWSLGVKELIIGKVGVNEFRSMVLSWLPFIDQFGAQPGTNPSLNAVADGNEDILKGVVCACEFAPSSEMYRELTKLALVCYRKVPGVGPSRPKVGNACILVLGRAGDLDAVGQLALLKVKVKFIPAQKMIEKALTESAGRQGLPRDEIEEMSVPDYGLEEVGGVTMSIGDASVEVRVPDSSTVQVQWRNSQGKPIKSAPAALKASIPMRSRS